MPVDDLAIDIEQISPLESEDLDDVNDDLAHLAHDFDITAYLGQPEPVLHKSIGPGGKKIDMEAQRYVLDDSEDDQIDVETVSNCTSPVLQRNEDSTSPVLEAGDVDSLLAQFEAKTEHHLNNSFAYENFFDVKADISLMPIFNDFSEWNTPNKLELDVKVEDVKPDLNEIKKEDNKPCIAKIEPPIVHIKEETSIKEEKKLTVDELPQKLLDRMKLSSKKKTVSVIPAQPNKKRSRQSNPEKIKIIRQPTDEPEKKILKIEAKTIKTEVLEELSSRAQQRGHYERGDHNYCLEPSQYFLNLTKDSGFESGEEDEKYSIRNQPTVKNSDGKLMVSLLKANTLRNHAIKQKRKLNLEEYKKRRELDFKSSASNSPLSSGRESPLIVEDEKTKQLKHQELLMKMASEVLKAKKAIDKNTSKSNLTELPPIIILNSKPIKITSVTKPTLVKKNVITPPPNLEVKTIVSVGTNTEETLDDCKKLDEIKPILEKSSVKISTNSLIASMLQNIPKLKSKQKVTKENNVRQEHGEDKTIVYLDKNRPKAVTCSVYVQTDFCKNDLIEKRRRSSASWSSQSRSESSSSRSSR